MRWQGLFLGAILCAAGCAAHTAPPDKPRVTAVSRKESAMNEEKQAAKVVKSEAEWKQLLTPEQYHILREKGTERPFTGKYWNMKADGTYVCAACGQELFKSSTKFDSDCGWPSFWDAMDSGKVITRDDNSFGMHRIEVLCARCGSHLGHVFDDGPNPTGKRYCINSESLQFHKSEPAVC